MRYIWFLVGVFTCSIAFGQQPQRGTPDISVLRPEYSSTPANNPISTDSLESTRELKELIRVQTEAIRTLSDKVDALDERLRRIESKIR